MGSFQPLRVVVQPSGAKSYAIRFRHGGRTKKFTIGSTGAYSLAEARDAARQALVEATRGVDPMEQKRASRDAARDTDGLVESAVEDFIKRHVSGLKSAPHVERLLRVELKPWRGRHIQDIAKKDVIKLIDAVHDRGSPTTARLLLANIKKFFSLVDRTRRAQGVALQGRKAAERGGSARAGLNGRRTAPRPPGGRSSSATLSGLWSSFSR